MLSGAIFSALHLRWSVRTTLSLIFKFRTFLVAQLRTPLLFFELTVSVSEIHNFKLSKFARFEPGTFFKLAQCSTTRTHAREDTHNGLLLPVEVEDGLVDAPLVLLDAGQKLDVLPVDGTRIRALGPERIDLIVQLLEP